MLKYVCPLLVVADIAVSRRFYEQLLGQKVRFDFGEDVQFEGDFSIHDQAHFVGLLGDARRFPVTTRAHAGELFFASDDIDTVCQRLKAAGVEFIHAIREEPWGIRTLRVYDPDGHIIEIGESIEAAILRLHRQGLSVEALAERTGMMADFIQRVIKEH